MGSIFLRNFYVGLDFEYNSLAIGLNKNNEDAIIVGTKKVNKPGITGNDDDKNGSGAAGTVIFVLIFLSVVLVVAIACYIRSKRLEK